MNEAQHLAQLRKQQQQQSTDDSSKSKPSQSGDSDEDGDSTSSVDTHLDECDICDDGGDLLCCDGCEKAYHPECLKVDEDALPDIWYGPCCVNRRSPVKASSTAEKVDNKSGDKVAVKKAAAPRPQQASQPQKSMSVSRPMLSGTVPVQRSQPVIPAQGHASLGAALQASFFATTTAAVKSGNNEAVKSDGAPRPQQINYQRQVVPVISMQSVPVPIQRIQPVIPAQMAGRGAASLNRAASQSSSIAPKDHYGYGDRYSSQKVKARHKNDGSVVPVQQPKQLSNGEYQRPIGRQRKEMDWDAVRGVWIPQGTSLGGANHTSQVDKEAGLKVTVQSTGSAPKESMVERRTSNNAKPDNTAKPPGGTGLIPPRHEIHWSASKGNQLCTNVFSNAKIAKPASINPVQAALSDQNTAKPAASQVAKNTQQQGTQSVAKSNEFGTNVTKTKPIGAPIVKTSDAVEPIIQHQLKSQAAVSTVQDTTVQKSLVSSALSESNKPPSQGKQSSATEQASFTQTKSLPQCKQPAQTGQEVTQFQATNSIPNTDTTVSVDSKMGTFRYVAVPTGVREGTMFHVLLGGGDKIGVICPKGVKPGQTIIVMEPGCNTAPISPEKIVQMNEARFMEGFDGKEAAFAKHSFWEVLFPRLITAGWTFIKEKDYNFGAYTFIAPGDSIRFEKVADILKFAAPMDSYKDALREFHTFIEKQKETAQRTEDRKRKLERDELSEDSKNKIRVGSKYQVRTLPRAGSYEHTTSSIYIHQQLWSNEQSSTELPADLYNTEESNQWKEWAKEEVFAGEFHKSVMEYNKELLFVSKAIEKPIGFCLWYYYNTYKQSENYQLLKAHLRKLQLEQGRNRDECTICYDGGELLCCGTCPNAYHPRCLGLASEPLDETETWSCPVCVNNRTGSCRSPLKSPRKSLKEAADGSPQKPEQLFSDTINASSGTTLASTSLPASTT